VRVSTIELRTELFLCRYLDFSKIIIPSKALSTYEKLFDSFYILSELVEIVAIVVLVVVVVIVVMQ
jgi:hypothetical protein